MRIRDSRRILDVASVVSDGAATWIHAATDRIPGPPLAVRTLRSQDEQALAGLRREYSILARLRHPGIPRVHELSAERGRHYFTMEFISAWTLETVRPILDTRLLEAVLVDVLRTLAYADARDFVHGDIRPSHIVLGFPGCEGKTLPERIDGARLRAVLIGWGSAVGPGIDPPSTMSAVAPFAAPEAPGGRQDHRSDIYSLGMSLIHAYADRAAADRREVSFDQGAALDEIASIDGRLSAVLGRMVQTDPDLRYRIASEVLLALGDGPGRAPALETPETAACYGSPSAYLWPADLRGILQSPFAARDARDAAALPAGPSLFLVRGEAGSGLSRLVREVRLLAELAGWTIVRLDPAAAPPPGGPPAGAAGGLREGRDRPHGPDRILLIAEDLHRADTEALGFLRSLGERPFGPILLATCRSDVKPEAALQGLIDSFLSRPHARVITVERLTPEQSRTFVERSLGIREQADHLASELHALTGGNPRLLRDALCRLMDNGHVSRVPGGWRIPPSIEALGLETDLGASALEGIEEADPASIRILEHMAILDGPATPETLKDLMRRDVDRLERDLAGLVDKGVVWCRRTAHGSLYGFRHEIARRAFRARIPPMRRRALHRNAGEWLERRADAGDGDLLDRAAHHYLDALDPEKGPICAFRAAAAARKRFSIPEAIALYRRGLELLPPARTDLRFEALERLTEILVQSGDLPGASRRYHEILLLARTVGDPIREALAIRELARLHLEAGDLARSLGYAVEAESRYAALSDRSGENDAILIQAQAYLRMGRLDAAESLVLQASKTMESAGNVTGQAMCKTLSGLISIERGETGPAIEMMNDAFALRAQVDDFAGMAVCLNNLGLAFLEGNSLSRAGECFERAIAEARDKALSLVATLASLNLGEVHRLQGNLETARRLLAEASELAAASGRQYCVAFASYNLGITSHLLGDFDSALRHINDAEIFYRGAQSGTHLVHAAVARTMLLRALGSRDGGQDLGEDTLLVAEDLRNPQLLEICRFLAAPSGRRSGSGTGDRAAHPCPIEASRGHGATWLFSRLLALHAGRLLDDGRADDALAPASEIVSLARQSGLRADLAEGLLLEGRALWLLRRPRKACRSLEEGAALAREMGLRPHLSRLLFWISRTHETLGDARAAGVSAWEACRLVREMADGIADDHRRRAYLDAPENLAAFGQARRLAGARPTVKPPSRGAGPGVRRLLSSLLDDAVAAVCAHRALLVLLDASREEIAIARGHAGQALPGPAGLCRTILRDISDLDPVLVPDAGQDGRLRPAGSVSAGRGVSLMCVPLRLGARLIGALYFDSRAGNRPFSGEDLALARSFAERAGAAITDALTQRQEREEILAPDGGPARGPHPCDLIGESAPMHAIFDKMQAVARADCCVLVTGESGTGKELVAGAIHRAGSRRDRNFVPLDCGALPDSLVESELFGHRRGAFSGAGEDKRGLLEEADGGTIFLDEIANTSASFQAKLLRALQSGEFRRLGETAIRRVDVRVIAATNADIDAEVREGRFREDLYYRLDVVRLTLPSLRERREDIPRLSAHFGRKCCENMGLRFRGIARGAMVRLLAYAWPGNVRELEHAVEAALVASGDGVVRREALPGKVLGNEVDAIRDLLEDNAAAHVPENGQDERGRILEALASAGGDKSRAARSLGWSRMRLYRRMRRLGIAGGDRGEPS